MTCIIGMVEGNTLYMGGDSQVTDGGGMISPIAHSKIFKKSNMLFGITGLPRLAQILQFSLKIPEHATNFGAFEYLCTFFIDAVRDCLKESGFAQIKDNVESQNSRFMLGYKNRLFEIEYSFQVIETTMKYRAIGHGEDYAYGAMEVLMDNKEMSPREKIRRALKAVAKFDNTVSSPFVIKTIISK